MRKQIRRTQPQKALKIDRTSQPGIGLDELLKTPAAVDLPCQEFPTPAWFEHSGVCDLTVVIPVSSFTPAIAKSIEMMPSRPKPSVSYFYINSGPDDVAINIIKTWEKRKLKRPIGRVFKAAHAGSIIKALASEIKSSVVSFLHPEALPDQYWFISLMKSPNAAPILVWRDKIFDQCIYSAGVDWHNNKFMHIGREFWNGMLMPKPHHISDLPGEYRSLSQHTLTDWNGVTVPVNAIARMDTSYSTVEGMVSDYTTSHPMRIDSESIVTVCRPYFVCDGIDLTKYYNKWIISGRLSGHRPKRILVKKLHDRVREAGEAAIKLKSQDTILIFFTDKPEELSGLGIDRIVTDEDLVSNRTFQVYYDLDGSDSFASVLGLNA